MGTGTPKRAKAIFVFPSLPASRRQKLPFLLPKLLSVMTMSSISPNTVLFKEGDEAQGKEFAKEKVNFVKHDFGSFDESIPDLEEEPEELYADDVTEHPGMRVFEWFEVRIFEQPRLTWGQQWMPYHGLLEVFVDLFDEMYHNVYMQELVMDLLPYVSTRDIIGISHVLDESIVPPFGKKFYYMAILYSGIEVERFDQAQTVSFLRWCLNEWRTPFNHSVLACVMQSVLAWRYAIDPMRSIADLATPQGQNVVRLTEEEVGLIPADSFWHYIFRDVVRSRDLTELSDPAQSEKIRIFFRVLENFATWPDEVDLTVFRNFYVAMSE